MTDESGEYAMQAQPHMVPPNIWTLTLNRYQRDNLLLLVQKIMEGDDTPVACFNSGDWVGEIRWMLGKTVADHAGYQTVTSIDGADRPNPLAPPRTARSEEAQQ